MPQQSRIRWAQLRVGILAIAALVILGMLIFLLSGSHGFFKGEVEIYTYLGDSSDLADGAPVRLNGIDIGKVKDIRLSGSDDPRRVVKIVMQVYDEYLRAIPVDSSAKMAQGTLLSPRFMNISKGSSKETIRGGAELKSGSTAELEDIFQQGNSTLAALEATVKKVDGLLDLITSGQGSIGKLLVDPTLTDKAVALENEAQKMLSAMNTTNGTLGALINDRTLYEKFMGTVDRLNGLLDEIQHGNGTVGLLVKDRAVYDNAQAAITDLRKSLDQVNTMLADLNAGKGSAGKILKSDDLTNQIHETLAKLDTTLDKVNSGQGTIGQLLNNPSLYESVDGATRELHGLLKDFRGNPKKFLSIKLHIF
jgi:phospholipid/cholesterol/gamma-HCH transport system substrate-binding protein